MAFTQENAVDMHSVGRETHNTRENCPGGEGGGAYRSCQKHEFLSLHDIAFFTNTGPSLLGFSFIGSLNSRKKGTALFWAIT